MQPKYRKPKASLTVIGILLIIMGFMAIIGSAALESEKQNQTKIDAGKSQHQEVFYG